MSMYQLGRLVLSTGFVGRSSPTVFHGALWGSVSRIVLLVGGYAFKFPTMHSWRLFLLGLLANMQEKEFSDMKHPKMCPVLFSIFGGFLSVMKRATPITKEQYDSLDYSTWINEPEVIIPVENKHSSFGMIDGRIVAIDYGSSHTYDYRRAVSRLEVVNRTVVSTTLADLQGVFDRVSAGEITLQAGVAQAVDELAARGITGHIGLNGRRYELATYVRADIQTHVTQTTANLGFARMNEYSCDLLVVSAHAGARPRCFPFQGRVFSRSGTHKKYAPWSSTSYGEIAGLLGRNCGHFVDPFIEGLDRVPTREERDPARYDLGKSNADVYDESQEQRRLERGVRRWKHRETALKDAGVDAGRTRVKVKEWQARVREYTEGTGRTRRYDREKAG